MIEAIYLGLRKTEGIDLEAFQDKFGVSFYQVFGQKISDLKQRGLLEANQSRCALSLKGMLFLDSITAMFVCQEI
jgi:oxygen-independent coproporphyrinogen-3 oxidase